MGFRPLNLRSLKWQKKDVGETSDFYQENMPWSTIVSCI